MAIDPVRKCEDCGDTEEECNLTHCHECDKTICEDNCVAAENDEHGLDWCHECYDRLKPRWDAERAANGDDGEED